MTLTFSTQLYIVYLITLITGSEFLMSCFVREHAPLYFTIPPFWFHFRNKPSTMNWYMFPLQLLGFYEAFLSYIHVSFIGYIIPRLPVKSNETNKICSFKTGYFFMTVILTNTTCSVESDLQK